ncbi:MAG: YbaB/EbfC family nucleoid-associated protein [Bacillota bacterium]|nr:YbaB/EbfC family nucleoid-associated protein [Bacillota bacterium]
MSKKFKGGMPRGAAGMGGMQNIMRQAQKMQAEMERKQAELKEKVYEVQSGGGAVKLKMNGDREILELILSEDVVDRDDIEMLQDLIIIAFKEANAQVDKDAEDAMGAMTGGLSIPGLF